METEAPPVVLDVGSGLTKLGLANQASPQHVFSTVVARPKNFHRSSEMPSDAIRFGAEAERAACAENPSHVMKFPVEWGVVTNWELLEDLLEHALFDLLKGAHAHTSLLLTEPPLNPRCNREKYTQLLFETFEAPALMLANTCSLTAYSAGVLNALVVECGHGATNITPVYEGVALRYAVPKCEFAGCDVLWHLEGPVEQRLRSQQPGAALTSAHAHRRIRPLVRDILHQHCYVALDYQRELRRLSEGLGHAEHPLPDGTTLKLSTELVECTELLFDNSIRKDEQSKLPSSVRLSQRLIKSPEVQEAVSGHVVAGGALSCLPGFTERLERELNQEGGVHQGELVSQGASALPLARTRTQVRDLANRQYSAWVGGSVLASMSGFSSSMCISKEEYDEYGPTLAHRKCFL